MRLKLIGLVCLVGWMAHAQVPPPPAATPAQVTAGTSRSTYISPWAAAQAGLVTEEGAVNMAASSNFAYAVSATNANGFVTLRQFGAPVNAHQFNGSGTDAGAAFHAAITARPNTNGVWIIDGEGLTYTLRTGSIWGTNGFVILRNFNLVITNVEPKFWITIAHDYCRLENVTIRGPGTNFAVSGTDWQAKAGSVGIVITNRIDPAYGDGNHAVDHVGLEDVVISGFATNISVYSAKNLTMDRVTSCNARYANLHMKHLDGVKIRDSHFTSWYHGDGFASPFPFLPTNTPNQWISNCWPILVTGPANGLKLDSVGAGGGRGSLDIRNVTGLIVDNLHVEDVNNLQVVRALVSLSNVVGASFRGHLMQKVDVPVVVPDCFDFLFIDSPTPLISIDNSGSKWGALPMVAAYFNSTAHGGDYLPAVSVAENRRVPRVARAFTYRVLTDLTAMTGSDTTFSSASGTIPNTDSGNTQTGNAPGTLWTGTHEFSNSIAGAANTFSVRGKIHHYGGSANTDIDYLVGADFGTVLRSGDNRVWTMGASASGASSDFAVMSVQSVAGINRMRLGHYYGLNNAGAQELYVGTAPSYGAAGVNRWWWNSLGHFLPIAAYNIGSEAAPVSKIYVGAGGSGAFISSGSGTPEGVVVADIGSIFVRLDGSTSTTLYIKTANNGLATGWTAK